MGVLVADARAGREGLLVRNHGHGEAVLWVHGYTLDSTIWAHVWAALPGWRHVGVDLPGHGGSESMVPGESLPALARRLVRLAREYDVRHLAGLSFGGMVCLQMAIEAPETFATVTLSSPALGGGPADPHAQTRNRALGRLFRLRGAGSWMTELWMTSPPNIFLGASEHPELWARLQEIVDRHTWAELADGAMEQLSRYPTQVRELDRITTNVLVIVGEDDMPSFKRSAELLRRSIGRCKRIYCAEAGHLALLEQTSTLAPIVQAHLEAAPLMSLVDS
jgi:pimeloyl-ACP methyl ester carboxylesterase